MLLPVGRDGNKYQILSGCCLSSPLWSLWRRLLVVESSGLPVHLVLARSAVSLPIYPPQYQLGTVGWL